MSALPPKADMCGANTDVRFGPKADIGKTLAIRERLRLEVLRFAAKPAIVWR
jgi:hypothetical protein